MVSVLNPLAIADIGTENIIKSIDTKDKDIQEFLFSLGCYEGETITIVSKIANSFVVSIKDSRYSFDRELADCIFI